MLGIQIAIDWSWIFIVVLLTWGLASWFFVAHPEWGGGVAIITAFAGAILFFASVLLHELAHSLVAKRFGIPVSSITLFLLGGISNIEREPPSPKVEFLMALVGPLTSIVVGIILLSLGAAVVHIPPGAITMPHAVLMQLNPPQAVLMWLGPINILVGLFNLIPAFPLDGGRLLRSVLWAATRSLHNATRWASAIGQSFGWLLVALGVLMAFGASVPLLGRGLVAGLWVGFIGWFLASAARQTWNAQLLHESLEGMTVSRLMRPEGPVIPPETSVSSLVNDWLMHHRERSFPVVEQTGRLLGVVTLADARKTPRKAWESTPVSRVMTPAEATATTTAHEDLGKAVDRLAHAEADQLPVVDGDRLVGTLASVDVARWIELHLQPPVKAHTH